MDSTYLYWPPLSPGTSTTSLNSLDDWFAITRPDTRVTVTEVDSDSDSDSDYVLLGSDADTESDIVYFAPPRADAHWPVRPPTPLPPAVPPAAPVARRVIQLNARKVSAQGFHATAELDFGERWVGYDAKIRRQKGVLRYLRTNRTRFYHVADAYPLADVVFRPSRQTTPAPSDCRRAPVGARMSVRVVDAAQELSRRLSREAEYAAWAGELRQVGT
jgi:hypothetical protein